MTRKFTRKSTQKMTGTNYNTVGIDQMVKWSDKWMITFNGDKCKILHLGKNNPKYQCFINKSERLNIQSVLKETKFQKDLGVNVDPELNFNDHI